MACDNAETFRQLPGRSRGPGSHLQVGGGQEPGPERLSPGRGLRAVGRRLRRVARPLVEVNRLTDDQYNQLGNAVQVHLVQCRVRKATQYPGAGQGAVAIPGAARTLICLWLLCLGPSSNARRP